MTPIEIRALDCLNKVSMRIASSGKRFRRHMNWELENEERTNIPFRMTARQALYLWFLVYMYRRQISDADILGYATQRKLTDELPPIYRDGDHREPVRKKSSQSTSDGARRAPAVESAAAADGGEQQSFSF